MGKSYLVAAFLLAMIQFSTAQNDTVRLAVSPQTIGCQPGSTITVPVTMANGTNITACQFTLNWDASKLQFVTGSAMLLSPFVSQFQTFGTSNTGTGKLTFAWANTTGVNVPSATPIFTVQFNVIQAVNSSISIGGQPTSIHVGAGSSPVVAQKWKTFSGLISTGDLIPPTIICPSDTVIGGVNPLFVNDLTPIADDNCGLQSLSYLLSGATQEFGFGDVSGQETFNLGTTILTYIATDGNGNSASCSSFVSIGPDTLTVRAERATPDCGEGFFVDVVVDNFDDVVTLGFTLEWDETLVQFDSAGLLENQFIGVAATDLGYFQIANGKLTFAWYDAANHSALDGTRLFRVYFTNLGPSGASSAVIFTSNPTPQLAGSNSPAPMEIPVIWQNGLVETTDLIAPTIVCHADTSIFNVLPGEVPFPISGIFPTVTDNCTIDSIAYQLTGATLEEGELLPATELFFEFGTTTVTQIVWDAAGNSDTCSFLVNIVPAIEPEFFLPNLFVNCGVQKVFFEISVREFMDINGMGFVVSYDDNIIEIDSFQFSPAFGPIVNWLTIIDNSQIQIAWSGNPPPPVSVPDNTAIIRVYFSVIGQVGDLSQLEFVGPIEVQGPGGFIQDGIGQDGKIEIMDTQPPFFTTACPFSFTASAGPNCQAVVTWTEPVAMDLCDQSNVLLMSNFSPGATLPLGTTTVTYTAIDQSQNDSQCSFSITVEDNTPPFIKCPDNLTLDVNASCLLIINDLPLPDSISDNCTALADLFLYSNFSGQDTLQAGDEKFYIYTLVDSSGNALVCNFSIAAGAGVPPTVDFCPASASVSCDTASLFSLPVPTFSGGCGPLSFAVSPADTTAFPMGNTTVVFTAFSGSDTAVCQFVVNVFDNKPPVISACAKDTTIQAVSGCVATMPPFEIEVGDNCDDNVNIESSPAVGSQLAAGVHIILITATDASGNQSTCTYKITVQSAGNASFFNCPPNMVQMDTCAFVFDWDDPIPVGFCGLATVFESDTLNYANVFAGLVDTIFYTAIDGAGNSATCSFTLTVIDTIKPILECPDSITIDLAGNVLIDPDNYITNTDTVAGCGSVQAFFGIPPSNENCSAVNFQQNGGPTSGQFFPLGVNTINWRAIDASMNFATCQIHITVVDIATPTISGLPNPACPNGLVTLTTDSPANSQFVWTGPQGFTTTNDSAFIFGITASTAGPYTVSTLVNGCPAPQSAPFTVILAQKPVAVDDVYSVNIGEVIDSFDVFLNDQKTAGDSYQVTLLTPLAALDNLGQGLFTYTAPGTAIGNAFFSYLICSTTCPTLCDTALVTINVGVIDPPCEIIPKVITPNGDGSNDYWIIFCIDSGLFPNNELVVYNQWGDKVYEAAPYENNWRGTLFGESGRYLPDGTYFYIFKPSPTDVPVKGFLTIFK